MECERLDALWAGVWPKARAGDMNAVSAALRVMERRAKLLGLDAARSIDVTSGGTAFAPPRIVEIVRPERVGVD